MQLIDEFPELIPRRIRNNARNMWSLRMHCEFGVHLREFIIFLFLFISRMNSNQSLHSNEEY